MKALQDLVRSNIWRLKPYSSARDEYKGIFASVFLDANENPFNSPYNRYPDPLQEKVKEAICKIKEVSVANLFLGNGSDEAIDLVFRTFCEPTIDNVVAIEPTYGMYQVCADINNVAYHKVLLDSNFQFNAQTLLAATNQNTKVIFLCTPNNPTGNDLDAIEIEKVITQFEGIVVIDEAYNDFSDTTSYIHKLSTYPNIIVLQTFSKAWGCAAIRLGMAFASEEIIQLLNKVKYPYNVNELTQQEALRMLANYPQITQWIETLKKERSYLQEALPGLACVEKIFPTQANFILVRVSKATEIYNYLVRAGIIVRNRNNITLCGNCLRITVGSHTENETLLHALRTMNL